MSDDKDLVFICDKTEKIEALKEIIESSSYIVFFGGAGVSTESGIPDFRSESGLYHAMTKYGRSAEELISASFFHRNHEIFFEYYKENLVFPSVEPNDAHKALAKLEESGKLKGVITQNIDGLHQRAGSKNVLELHGGVGRNFCMKCGEEYSIGYIMEEENCKNEKGEKSFVPRCKKCGEIVKPNVVLYEEPLDEETMRSAIELLSEADTLIVGGTSLVVYPAAGLLRYFRGENLILINKSETDYDSKANLIINEAIGEVLGKAIL